MTEIKISREKEFVNQWLDYKLILSNGQRVRIGNGETKALKIQSFPISIKAKIPFVSSKTVIIDPATKALKVKGETNKNTILRILSPLSVVLVILPGVQSVELKHLISTIGLSLILVWIFYAMVIKNKDWIILEKVNN